LVVYAPDVYVFEFPSPAPGAVTVGWAASPGITDRASTPNAFVPGGDWRYTVNPDLPVPGVMISEFMADNDNTLNDEEGEASDWIELFNPTTSSANLTGWHLTDTTNNLAKWRFPAAALPAKGYLVIYASGKDRALSGKPLHTNFKLSAAGGYLALVDAAGEVVSEFRGYPEQFEDVSYGRDRIATDVLGYFSRATPGAANATGGPGFAPEVEFSVKGGTFATDFPLVLTAAHPDATIYYTLNGTMPTNSSTVYAGPIPIAATTQVRARAFVPGLLPGAPQSKSFIQLAATAITARSDLPLVILHTFGNRNIPAEGDIFAHLSIFEPQDGVSSFANRPDLQARTGINLRGSSTLGYPKPSLSVELWNEFNDDRNAPVIGMPSESDWVFYAPNNFEPILIHNSYAHQLSRHIGRYSPRTRFAEVYLNRNGGTVTANDYVGIYVIEEKIKRGSDRVDVPALEPEHTAPPQVTGGYLMKIDRSGSGEYNLWAGGTSVVVTYPLAEELNRPERQPQVNYLQGYLDAFGNALSSPGFTHPLTGYAGYIDVDSWIDHHLLNVITFNVDALRLSAYFYKERNGKLVFGPVWDFDRALNSTDGRDANPRLWRSAVGDRGTDFFGYNTQAWWGRLFEDLDFWQRWIDRWQSLREDAFSLASLHGLVDEQVNQLRQAQPREVKKWPGHAPRGGSYQAEVDSLKRWLSNRVDFIDTNFLRRPVPGTPAGPVAPGTLIPLTAPSGATIYYTLDGTDPRAPGGNVAAGARTYADPIRIDANTRLFARARKLSHRNVTSTTWDDGKPPLSTPWSGPVVGTYVVATPPLVISELMYQPAPPAPGGTNDPSDFEFIELQNVGPTTLDLSGFRLTNGVDYTFGATSAVRSLAPGAHVLLVRNLSAFQARYPGVDGVAGEFSGSLDNAGERLVLLGPLQEPIHDFDYDNAWYPVTAGLGFSLTVINPQLPPAAWTHAASWRPSAVVGGSPGREDAAPPALPAIRINELLAHTDLPQLDTLELYNPGPDAFDAAGWFLSDDFDNPRQFRLPAGRPIPAGRYQLFDEADFNTGPDAFSFSSLGEAVYLFSGDGTNLTGYFHGFQFGASANGVTFGRHLTSTGEEHFVAQAQTTLGTANAGPRIGPLAISELMYDPPRPGAGNNTLDEFLELQNLTAAALPLFDPLHPTNTWRVRGGVDFDFPIDLTLPPGGLALLVNFDPSTQPDIAVAFRAKYEVPQTVPLWGPYQGNLNNAGERVSLLRPDAPQTAPSPEVGRVPYILVDQVRYSNLAPWPTGASGTGFSIQRSPVGAYGDDPAFWQAAAPTAGRTLTGAADSDGDGMPDDWETA
ncbi:MAG: lamin tail domain-containing protein, partial [Limisphaerales bacterium]